MWAALEIAAHETVFVHANVESSSTGIFDCRCSVFFHQGKHTQDAADTGLSLPLIDQLAELAAEHGATVTARRAQRHFLGEIFFLDAIATALLAQMFAKKLVGAGMQDAHVQCVPLHLYGTSDPSWWQAVVGSLHFHATIQMDHTLSILVVAERLERKGLQVWFFFSEHRCDQTPGRSDVPSDRGTLALLPS